MSAVEERLASLGLTLPEVATPVAAYVPAVLDGRHVYTSGQLPIVSGQLAGQGLVGDAVTTEQAYELSRICVLNGLAAIKALIGDLDKVSQVVKVVGFVASADGFTGQAAVINGASELIKEAFGGKGAHARSALGVAQLPLGAPVEVEIMVALQQ